MSYRYFAGPTVAILLFYIVLAGAIMGASAGYTADDRADAELEYNGTHIITTDGVENVEIDWEDVEENPEKYQGPVQERVNDAVEPHVESTDGGGEPPEIVRTAVEEIHHGAFVVAIGVADVTATVTYYLSPVVPQAAVSGLFTVLGVVPMLALIFVCLNRLEEIFR